MNEERPLALILAVTSDIGRAIARRYAEAGFELIVTARARDHLDAEIRDLEIRYDVPVRGELLDIENLTQHDRLLQGLSRTPDVTVCAIGLMAAQQDAERDPALAARVMFVNYTGPALLLERIAQACATRGSGSIVGISSVAGERGRASNYIYGSAKAGFTAWLSGLRNRLHGSGVHVMTAKPGFVKTRMTDGLDTAQWLTSSPKCLAESVFKSYRKRRSVIYAGPIWRLIMAVIRLLPESLFKRTRL